MPRKPTVKQSSRKTKTGTPSLLVAKRLNQVLLLLVVVLAVMAGIKIVFFGNAAGGFVKLAVHPQASQQPTSYGKVIAALESWNGRLYSGFGDWGINSSVNTGPIAITPFNPATSAFSASPEVMAAAHSIHQWRLFNGRLYGPAAQNAGADYIMGALDSTGMTVWKNASAGGFTHAFDVFTLTGSDMWVVGQTGPYAIARRSLDGGETWQDMRSVTSNNGSSTARFFGGGVYRGKLYLQAINNDAGSSPAESRSKVFDPASATWSDGPSFGAFNHANEFAGKMIYSTSFASGVWSGAFRAYDGVAISSPGNMYVYNYTIDRSTGRLYVITTTGDVKMTTDLVTWTLVANIAGGRSVAVNNGVLYVGGSDSAIYKVEGAPGTGVIPDSVAPIVSGLQPANGSVVGNRVTIQASATDNQAVVKMELLIDGSLVKTSTSGSIKYGWNARTVASGQHTLMVKAYDAAGNVGQLSATVAK